MCESATYLIAKKVQERKELNIKLRKVIEEDGVFEWMSKEDSDVLVYEKK